MNLENPAGLSAIRGKLAGAAAVAWLAWVIGGVSARAEGVGAQVIATLERYRVAVVQMDFDDQIAFFTDDAVWSQSGGTVQGRAQIRALIMSQAQFKIVGYELYTAATRVQGNVAIQNGLFSQRIVSPQHVSRQFSGTFEMQWARQADGSWLIDRLSMEPSGNSPRQP